LKYYISKRNFANSKKEMAKSLIRICLVEDDAEIRRLTKEVLELNSDISCVATCDSAEAFMARSKHLEVDIVMMDIGLPGLSGIECVRKCTKNASKPNFIMYTTHFDANEVFEALKAGAKGYILKGGPPNRLVEDIYDMANGGSPMSPQISRLVIDSFHKHTPLLNEINSLTKQEWEVLSGLEKGLTYKEIATLKYVSAHTVRAQIRSIYEKLHVHNKVEAIRIYQKHL
jgi:DNA-binding NarL/FixJ family response regulator